MMACSKYWLRSSKYKYSPPDPVVIKIVENEMLLEIIFKSLGQNSQNDLDLRKCRLVCRQWNRVASKLIGKNNLSNRKFLEFEYDDDLKEYTNRFIHSGPVPLLSCFKMSPWDYFEQSLLDRFFSSFVHKITSLDMEFVQQSLIDLENMLESQSKSLTELKLLVRPDVGTDADSDSDSDLVSDADPFDDFVLPKEGDRNFELERLNHLCLFNPVKTEHMPLGYPSYRPRLHNDKEDCQHKVLEIILRRLPSESPLKICLKNWNDVPMLISLLTKYNRVKNLKLVEINEPVEEELRVLGNKAQVQYLIVDSSLVSITREVYNYLCIQSNHLEMLSWRSRWHFKFPATKQMKVMKKMRLRYEKRDPRSDDEIEWESQTHRPILYEHYFPKLEELELYSKAGQQPPEFLAMFLPPQLPCSSLRRFKIGYSRVNMDIMKVISSTFPLITCLEIGGNYKPHMTTRADEQNFYSVLWTAEFAPNLKELSIVMDGTASAPKKKIYELDNLFSGKTDQEIHKLLKCLRKNGFNPNQDFESEPVSQRPSILNLTSLRKLTLSHPRKLWRSRYFTDYSAFYIFAQMDKLEILYLDKIIEMFSKEALAHLKLKSLRITRMTEEGQHMNCEEKIDKAFCTDFKYSKLNLGMDQIEPSWYGRVMTENFANRPINLLGGNRITDNEAETSSESESADSDLEIISEEDDDSDSDTDSDE